MMYKRAYAGFALPLALAMACAACGNGNQDQPTVETQPVPGATVATPMSPPGMASTAMTPMSAMPPPTNATVSNPAGMTMQQTPKSFAELANGKDSISQTDAAPGSWMASHFMQCDDNHDGKVTQAEYDQCTRAAGVSSAPPMSSY